MTPATDDVVSPIDLRTPKDAKAWETEAMVKRPWRREFFARFAQLLAATNATKVLELGSGPGFLAEALLRELPGLTLTLLDSSQPMHELARARLGSLAQRATFVERSFKESGWADGLGPFDAVATMQAVHELRNKRHAAALHEQVRSVLAPGGMYLACDHFAGEGGMTNSNLFMTVDGQRQSLITAGFTSVEEVMRLGGLVLHRAMS